MDQLLLSYLNSTEASECERSLSELILLHASPLVRQTLRHRLGFFVSQSGANPNNPEAEDLYHDTLAKIIERLNEAKANPHASVIRDFRQYVTRVATNVCHDHLRTKSPARARAKDKLRDLLDRHPDFSIWKNDANVTLCGFRAWHNRNSTGDSNEGMRQLKDNLELFTASEFPGEIVLHISLTRLVAGVFNQVGSPVDVEDLVDVVSNLQGIKDYPMESIDDDEQHWERRLIDSNVRCDTRLEAREMLKLLWDEIRQLPQKQRDAICFSFEDASGDDLFTLLLDADVAMLPQIATEIERTLERVLILWEQMPMDSQSLAAELNTTRPQINLWRFRALKQLEKQLTLSDTRK